MASTLTLGTHLTYSASMFDCLKAKLNEIVSPGLVRGVHYAFNGPVREAIELHGNLTVLDYATLRVCCFIGLPNVRLEQKLRAIGDAFLQEAQILESI